MIVGVPSLAWSKFSRLMRTSRWGAVSASNSLGAFELTPRRLQDLGLFGPLKRIKSASGRLKWASSSALDHERAIRFLKSRTAQVKAFSISMADYASKISSNTVKLPPGCTLSGALAVCHKSGLAGLRGEMFPKTKELYDLTNGVF